MAGMEDYFGPRKKAAFDNLDDYVGRNNDDSHIRRNDVRWNDKPDENVVRKPNVLHPEIGELRIPPVMIQNRCLDLEDGDVAATLKYAKTTISISTLIFENLLSHPFVVLRRQCQVHNCSEHFHLFPFSLFPVIWRLNQRQGIRTLWKGLSSVFFVRGMSLAIEDAISKFTPWPKEFKSHSSVKAHGQHIMLKCLTFALVTPFYSASLVETVQSDIASEEPGLFSVFREGICRLVSWSSPQKGRMLPVWNLVIPSVVFGLLKYFIGIMIRNISSRILQLSYEIEQRKKGAKPKDYLNQATILDFEIIAGFIATVGAESILYPFETILHRIHLQGTRTIVDNLDSGTQVVPILTNYEGALDCYDSILLEEGVAGLYKGFGALTLQFAIHYLFIKLTKTIVTHATEMLIGSSIANSNNASNLPSHQQLPKAASSPSQDDTVGTRVVGSSASYYAGVSGFDSWNENYLKNQPEDRC